MAHLKIQFVAATGAVLLVGGIILFVLQSRQPSDLLAPAPTPGAVAPPATATAAGEDDATIRRIIDRMNSRALDQAPALAFLAESDAVEGDGRAGAIAMNGKFMGRAASANELMAAAYGVSRSRLRLSAGVRWPEGRFDYLVSLASGQREALQKLIREKLGLTARPQMREEDVFVLTARGGEFQNLRPSDNGAGGTRVRHGDGELNLENASIGTLVRNLEPLLALPVVDESGLRGRYDMVLTLDPPADRTEGRPSAESVRKAASDQLGLELQRDKRELEVLLVENAGKG